MQNYLQRKILSLILLALLILGLAAVSAGAQQNQLLPPVPTERPPGPLPPEEFETITDPMIVDPLPEHPQPARESNRLDLVFGSGSQQHRIYLPLLKQNATLNLLTQPEQVAVTPVSLDVLPICPGTPPWISRHGMTAALFEESLEDYWDNYGFRPISVSANGSGADTRFSAIWINDGVQDWRIHYDMTGEQYNDIVRDYHSERYRPVVIDAYGSGSGLRYTAIWVQDANPFGARHGIGEETMNEDLELWEAAGYRPIWVTGHEGGAGPHFAALWVFDGLSGTARIGLTRAELTGTVGQAMTDAGNRLLQISGYLVDDEDDPVRYAATWIKDAPQCGLVRWEAFDRHSSTQYQIKASAQTFLGEQKVLIGSSITLSQTDLSGEIRIANLPLRHFLGTGGIGELSSINEEVPGQVFQQGDILVLRLASDDRVLVRERSFGNIRLRPWDANDPQVAEQCESGSVTCPPIEGQAFFLDDRQYRLVLQYDAADGVWRELQRNGISHDAYWPLALDDYGETGERRYASVWVSAGTTRTWRVTGPDANLPGDPLAAFDNAMRRYMEERNVPGGTLAVVKDGRLVLARGYTWDEPEVLDMGPQRRFRLASIAKSLTAVGVMQFVEAGTISLDQRIVDIPGMAAVLSPADWVDPRIQIVTVRHLLHHLGGWDRDISGDPMVTYDFSICQNTSNTLPTTAQAIIEHMRTQPFDHTPGTVYAYSNFGYTLLGRIIEVLSGQSYQAYMQANVFGPSGMQHTQLSRNTHSDLDFREVRYYQPLNQVVASRLGFNDDHPFRDICRSLHANQVPNAYGGLNLAPMDAHGGWSSTAVDLARFLSNLDDESLLSYGSQALMWQRPEGRTRRVYIQDFGGGGIYNDYTWQARGNSTFPLMDEQQDVLFVGKGLVTFDTIEIELSQPGQNYTLVPRYFNGNTWVTLTEDDHNLQDESENFTVSGSPVKITFTPPEDWTPVTLPAANDNFPRYWIILRTETTPAGPPAVAEMFFPSGEANYGLGWTVGHSAQVPYWLPYTPTSDIFVDELVIGAQSKASGVVNLVFHEPGGLSWLRLLEVEGGPFLAGELLNVPADPRGEVRSFERTPSVVASHNGLLRGTITEFKRRPDGIHWVVLFNHDKDGAFYIKSEGGSQVRLDTIINNMPEADWPAHDLFDLLP